MRAITTLLAVAFALSTPPAWGQQEDPPSTQQDEAQQRKTRADAAMGERRYADAVGEYLKAYELGHDARVLYNLGQAYSALGRFPDALRSYERFRDEAPPELRQKVPNLDELISHTRGRVSSVTIDANVEGARVVLRSEVVGTTPLDRPLQVNSGPATLELIKEGYLPFKKEMTLPGGGLVSVDAVLRRHTASGILIVRSPVVGAQVAVDGRPVGAAPAEVVLSGGEHQVVVTHEDYDQAEVRALVAVGQRKTVNVALERTSGFTSQWWFWTGVGVIVVGGVVAVVAASTEKEAETGTLSPGQVGAPLMTF